MDSTISDEEFKRAGGRKIKYTTDRRYTIRLNANRRANTNINNLCFLPICIKFAKPKYNTTGGSIRYKIAMKNPTEDVRAPKNLSGSIEFKKGYYTSNDIVNTISNFFDNNDDYCIRQRIMETGIEKWYSFHPLRTFLGDLHEVGDPYNRGDIIITSDSAVNSYDFELVGDIKEFFGEDLLQRYKNRGEFLNFYSFMPNYRAIKDMNINLTIKLYDRQGKQVRSEFVLKLVFFVVEHRHHHIMIEETGHTGNEEYGYGYKLFHGIPSYMEFKFTDQQNKDVSQLFKGSEFYFLYDYIYNTDKIACNHIKNQIHQKISTNDLSNQ